ncbi:MAG: methyltransferase domain-containing protein [Candidatus Hydrogenedentota bacterium]
MPSWDANLYLQFGTQRTQAAIDLTARISIGSPARVIDLGCGPGNSTEILRQRWPEADITGLDTSADMIAQASERDLDVTWVTGDIATWSPEDAFDIVFTNAALQWLPNHEKLLAQLMNHVVTGGVLAVQLPYHHASPLQQVVLKASRDPQWNDAMDSARNALTYATTGFYYDTLQPLCNKLDLWETEYIHIMDDPVDIVDFIRGSGLRPFTQALNSEEEVQRFEKIVLQGYTNAYPPQADGRILFPFRRQFIIAHQ